MKLYFFLLPSVGFFFFFLFFFFSALFRDLKGLLLEKGRAAPVFLVLISAGFFYMWVSSPLRGGYDDNHDFGYAGTDLLKGDFSALSGKEFSPLLDLALSDAVSGYRLSALPLKNSLLVWLSGFAVLFGLFRLTGSLSAGLSGFFLLLFNFLAPANASSFSTTASNLLFFSGSFYAAASFYRTASWRDFLWLCFSSLLLLEGRYEAAPPFLFLLLVFLFYNSGKGDSPVFKKYIFAATSFFALFWFLHLRAITHYNGPPPISFLGNIWPDFFYQLWEGNYGFINGSGSFLFAVIFAVFLICFWLLPLKFEKEERKFYFPVNFFLTVFILYFAAIFNLRDEYPLQFMRHRLYFFLPFCYLLSLTIFYGVKILNPAPAFKVFFLSAMAFFFFLLNLKTLNAFSLSARTNDEEWRFLLKAQRLLPSTADFFYPYRDSKEKIILKYFKKGFSVSQTQGLKLFKYKSSEMSVFKGYDSDYISSKDSETVSASFLHKFYTVWDSEEKKEIPVKIGFYEVFGAEAQKIRSFENAKALFEKSKKFSDEGVNKVMNGNYRDGEKLLLKAIEIQPENFEALLSLCSVYYREGRKKEAIRFCLQAEKVSEKKDFFSWLGGDDVFRLNLEKSLYALGEKRKTSFTLK